jgi:hypothetical protein
MKASRLEDREFAEGRGPDPLTKDNASEVLPRGGSLNLGRCLSRFEIIVTDAPIDFKSRMRINYLLCAGREVASYHQETGHCPANRNAPRSMRVMTLAQFLMEAIAPIAPMGRDRAPRRLKTTRCLSRTPCQLREEGSFSPGYQNVLWQPSQTSSIRPPTSTSNTIFLASLARKTAEHKVTATICVLILRQLLQSKRHLPSWPSPQFDQL